MNASGNPVRGFRSRYDLAGEDVLYAPVMTPAAGANATYVIATFAMRVIAARATFTPDGNAASRIVSLDFLDSNGVVRMRNQPALTFAASSGAQAFEWNRAWHVSEWNSGTAVTVPVNDCILDPGMTIRFTAQSIQVGDTFTAVSLVLLTVPSIYPG